MIFDTHAHYDDEAFNADREALIESLPAAGVARVIDVASDVPSLERVMAIAHRWPFIFAAAGLHPDNVGTITPGVWERLGELLRDDKVVAVGEIGFDYYWNRETHEVQEKWFRAQIELALERGNPIIVHSRDACEDTLRVIRSYYGDRPLEHPGIIHCYGYSPEVARIYTGMGFKLGIGGVVTFKNSKRMKRTVEETDLHDIVLETDCPYLSPVPHRGERNSSLNLPFVVETIAALKGVTPKEVEAVTFRTAEELFPAAARGDVPDSGESV